ncbi:uncharacterized protein Dwil_GK27942 [Drosophila willistoni]|uniref:Copper transporter n=1 Tax=Drosophila willistoni TaxID=7260 RepID=A0A0Q9X2H3_DROWI|nr:uncharacterized protein LOC26529944 [Drosophila willistoni]KRF98428.1 uncharacterized protein Dwil_GK27942 [Drosophila willistoni]
MFPNPIEVVCIHIVQPIIDLLAYLLNEVHFLAFMAGCAVLGITLGLIFGIISVVWYKCSRETTVTKKQEFEGNVNRPINSIKND